MEFFIHKLCSGKHDELTHLQFEKYSRGYFKDKAVIKIKKSKDGYNIATTYEYANEFALFLAEKLGSSKTNVTGVIVSTRNLNEDSDLKEVLKDCQIKQFAGVKQFIISKDLSGDQIKIMIKKFPRAFFGLSFNVEGYELKTKAKAPKSAKPKTKDEEEINPDFCKLKTSDKGIINNFIFDFNKSEFKELTVSHDWNIEDIEVPRDEKDPVKMRERAIRKGKIIRKLSSDGKSENKEFYFYSG